MSSETKKCPVCDSNAVEYTYDFGRRVFVECPVCGRFEYYPDKEELAKFNLNHLAAYFIYNGFKHGNLYSTEYRYFTTMSKEKCDEYRVEFNNGNIEHGHPVHLSIENVENWYPKKLTDKINFIITFFNNKASYIGEKININKESLISCLFVDRYKFDVGNKLKKYYTETDAQVQFMLDLLKESKLINPQSNYVGSMYVEPIQLTPEAYSRIEQLEKNNSHGKDVLVAMKFGEETKNLREAIRKGILEAEYNPIFIDEVEHNDFITPELLKYIRDSKFVVVDLSHQNNGAYFEEGYAMGLGKPVIQLCKSDVTLHFDIAQKNTIMWNSEDEISLKLKNRIIATIE